MNKTLEKKESHSEYSKTEFTEKQISWMEKNKRNTKKRRATIKSMEQQKQNIFTYMFNKLNDYDKKEILKKIDEQDEEVKTIILKRISIECKKEDEEAIERAMHESVKNMISNINKITEENNQLSAKLGLPIEEEDFILQYD